MAEVEKATAAASATNDFENIFKSVLRVMRRASMSSKRGAKSKAGCRRRRKKDGYQSKTRVLVESREW